MKGDAGVEKGGFDGKSRNSADLSMVLKQTQNETDTHTNQNKTDKTLCWGLVQRKSEQQQDIMINRTSLQTKQSLAKKGVKIS